MASRSYCPSPVCTPPAEAEGAGRVGGRGPLVGVDHRVGRVGVAHGRQLVARQGGGQQGQRALVHPGDDKDPAGLEQVLGQGDGQGDGPLQPVMSRTLPASAGKYTPVWSEVIVTSVRVSRTPLRLPLTATPKSAPAIAARIGSR